MKAVTYHGIEDVRSETVADPHIQHPSDVVIRVERAGICGSDLHPYFGREKGLDPGTVMGHEAVGTIVDAGAEVKRLRPGDQVFTPFTTSCGSCFFCRADLTCRCVHGQLYGWVERGQGLPGLQAEFARIPLAESTLLRVPEGITPDEALLLGDILSTGYYCAERAGIQPHGSYVVIGCGPVGIMTVIAARQLGAQRVYALDPVPERLILAAHYGATPLPPGSGDPVEALRAVTGGYGADAVMEVVGSPSAARLALDLIRPGGVISVVGVHSDPQFSFSPAEAYAKNLTYRVGRCPARYYMEKLAPWVASHAVDFSPLFSHRMPLSDGPEGYRLFASRGAGCTKVVLET